MYARLVIIAVSIAIAIGEVLNPLKRDNCDACSNFESFTSDCETATNIWKCVCSDDKLWSFYSSCYSCVGAPTAAKSNLRSLYCDFALNTDIPSSFDFGASELYGYSNSVQLRPPLALSPTDLESYTKSGSGVTSATSVNSAISESDKASKGTSSLTASSNVEHSKSSSLLRSSSSKSSSTSKADGNTLLAYQMTIGTFLLMFCLCYNMNSSL